MGRDYVLILVSLLLPLLFFNQANALMDYDSDRPRRGDAVVAIDIGNTNSCVAGYGHGRVETMFQLCIPSWVAFTDNGTLLVGDDARDHAAVGPGSAIFGFKRLIGRRWSRTEVVQRLVKTVPYKLVEKKDRPHVQVKTNGGVDKEFSLEDVTAMVIAKLKKVAEAYLGRTVRHVVFTVPVYYDDASRRATLDAGWLADLSATRILTEPTAAAIAYGLDRKLRDDRFALVLHVGGDTSAATFLTVFDDVFEAYGEHHDLFFGGEDFDQRIVDYFTKLIREKHGKDINNDKEALRKLRAACEHAKKSLSTQDHAQLSVESLVDGVDFSETLTRAKFEELNHDLFLKVVALVDRAMVEDIEKSMVDEIVLIGGSTMIPKIQELIRDYFDGKEPNVRLKPDEVVTFGAALLGHPTARD